MSRSGARHPDADEAATPVASTSKTRARAPEEEALELYNKLNEYLLLEPKFQPRLCLPTESENGEVTTGARDGAAHVLRCLKVWYDLPPEVLINAINLFDRFLTKMKVRPCHIPCITVSCMNIALEQYAHDTNTKRSISIEELVSISQSACTAGDACRMSRVIVDKLGLVAGCAVSALDWLRLVRRMLLLHAQQVAFSSTTTHPTEQELIQLLEIVSCDAACVNARTSELALVLVYHKLEKQLSEWSLSNGVESEHAYYLYDFARQLQIHCHMCDSSLSATRARVRHVVSRYERSEARRDQRQRLVWRLSERTLKVLRPTDRLGSVLPTIEEQHFQVDVTPARNRSGSESSENEETSDWPRSPEQELIQLLEIVSCDAACVNARTSELALVLVYHKLEKQLSEWSLSNGVESEHAYYLYDFARQLQIHCHMCDSSLSATRARVRHVVSRYERSEARRDQRQRLVWRLSERTLKVLRPTDRLGSVLPTIEEQHFQVDVTPARNRSGSESSENEETSDWPRSPVLPVYCDN